MYIFCFEKLEVWIEAKNFSKNIHTIASKFPETAKLVLISQLRTVSRSVASNIAEGCARKICKDKTYFTTIAFGSAVAMLNQLIKSFELNFVTETDYIHLRNQVESITNKHSLQNYQIDQI